MGEEIDGETFSADDRRRFGERCRDGLTALETLLARPGFGAGPPSLGAELEIGLVDRDGRPAPVNHVVREAMGEPRLDLELDRFNLEFNSRPVGLEGRPLTALGDDLADGLARLGRAAAAAQARPMTVGILPSLSLDDLGPAAMSDSARFRALGAGLRELRGGPFEIDIDGDEPLRLRWDDVTLEGAATGLHVHLRMPPSAFAAAFNAAQIAVAPALAAFDQLAVAAAAPAVGGDAGGALRAGGRRPGAGQRVVARLARVVRPRLDRRPDRALRRERGPSRPDPGLG